jgi:hypothetical protein
MVAHHLTPSKTRLGSWEVNANTNSQTIDLADLRKVSKVAKQTRYWTSHARLGSNTRFNAATCGAMTAQVQLSPYSDPNSISAANGEPDASPGDASEYIHNGWVSVMHAASLLVARMQL